MRFAYTYRSSDGQRHTAEIEAESRDAAFAKVRSELGIKPIKVTAAVEASRQDGGSPYGRNELRPSRRRKLFTIRFYLFVAIAALAAIAWWWLRRAEDGAPYQVMTPLGPVTYSVAAPLPRQAIPGDRQRVEAAVAQERDPPVFAHAAERWLARYAEPGRKIEGLKIEALGLKGEEGLARTRSGASGRPAPADFEAALREPIRIASTDFTEVVDLKRIVAGMKREMAAYLAELEKRQRLELSYRERAEQKLEELLAARPEAAPGQAGDRLKAAYAYWLKANAQLQAMGIYPLALPDALRAYQMGLDIEE